MTLPGPLGVGIALRSWQAARGVWVWTQLPSLRTLLVAFPELRSHQEPGELATVSQRAERLERQQLKGHNS